MGKKKDMDNIDLTWAEIRSDAVVIFGLAAFIVALAYLYIYINYDLTPVPYSHTPILSTGIEGCFGQ